MASLMVGLGKCSRMFVAATRRSIASSSALRTDKETKKDAVESEVTLEAEDETDETSSLRDISRMPKKYHDRMLHILNPPEAPDYYTDLFTTVHRKRKLYAHFGKKSGIDPGLMWPSKEELQENMEFEKEWEPSLQARWKKAEDEKNADIAERKAKRELVQRQMEKMPQLIQQYKGRLAKADEQERQLELKRQELFDEAREYFGYNIDPRDPRFEQLKEKKEDEEKALKKKKRKEEKLAKFMASLK